MGKKNNGASKDRVPNGDVAATRQKAANLYETPLPMMNLGDITISANLHPTPVHEPAMPAEVFYNKMALDEDFDSPNDELNRP